MKRLHLAAALVAIAWLSGCASVQEETRLTSPIRAREFNRVASQYVERPTFMADRKTSDGASTLWLEMDRYGGQRARINFVKSQVDAYLPLIAKFLDWEAIARQRGDLLTKDIGEAPMWAHGADGRLRFQFYSGSASAHFLVLTYCAQGIMRVCVDENSLYLDRQAAESLSNTLQAYARGELKAAPADQVYR